MQRYQKFSKKVFDKIGQNKVVAGAVGLVLGVQAQAALVAPTFDSSDAITIGTAVIGGLALIWGIKKAISLAK